MNEPLFGLVLAGGKSSRMGTSKAKIKWHGKEQQYYLADLLEIYCEEVFISCREDQETSIDPSYRTLPDFYPSAGLLEAMLSAFIKYPNSAWLIVACDLPMIDKQTLYYLKQQRDIHKMATVFESPLDGLPEPLVGIWEVESYELLKLHHQKEHTSLRKILISNGVKIIRAPDKGALVNVNTPEDAKYVIDILAKRK